MIDISKVSIALADEFITLARQAESAGRPFYDREEHIVVAFLNDRMDWLPSDCPDPLSALKRLHGGDPGWWHTLLYVHDRGWTTNSGRQVWPSYKW